MSQPRASQSNDSVVIRPSIRLVRPFYTLTFVLLGLHFFLVNNNEDWPPWTAYLIVVPILLFVWTVIRHLSLRFTGLTIGGGRLLYESGLTSRFSRAMEIAKIRNVAVNQSSMQRLVAVGDVVVETSDAAAPLIVRNIDRPQAVADFILEAARK